MPVTDADTEPELTQRTSALLPSRLRGQGAQREANADLARLCATVDDINASSPLRAAARQRQQSDAQDVTPDRHHLVVEIGQAHRAAQLHCRIDLRADLSKATTEAGRLRR